MTKLNKVLYIDMDGVLADFWTRMCELHPELKQMVDGAVGEYMDHLLEYHSPNVFNTLNPMEGAVEAFHLLAEVYDVHILSTPAWCAPMSYTHKRLWVERVLGEPAKKRLILGHNKNLLRGDYIIDDRKAHGVDIFEGEHIHFRTKEFPGWIDVVTYLRTKDNW